MPDNTILIIDYDPRSIAVISGVMKGAGHRVEVAKDGIAGFAAFQEHQPDLVLIEAMLPKKHGFEVCQEIKKSPNGKQVPVIICTAVYKGRKYRTQALHIYGCDEYVEKPIGNDELLAICNKHLATSRKDAAPAGAEEGQKDGSSAAWSTDAEEEILAHLDSILAEEASGGPPKAAAAGGAVAGDVGGRTTSAGPSAAASD